MYDYLLGGYHNFEIDRAVIEKTREIYPDLALAAQVGRAALGHAVLFLLDKGVTQFIDIGSGIPTAGYIHEILQNENINGTVVYVDFEPMAIAHSNAILRDIPNTLAILEDACRPEEIHKQIDESGIIDYDRPVALLFISLLHFIEDVNESRELVSRYRSCLASGSYLAFTYGTTEGTPPGVLEGFSKLSEASPSKAYYRNREDIVGIFEGLGLVEPGIVYTPLWHPESAEGPAAALA